MKTICTLAIVFLLKAVLLHAQPAFEWTKNNDCTNGSGGRSVVTDTSNFTYVAGEYRGTATFGSFTIQSLQPSSNAPACGFLVKYDSSGNEIWAKNILAGITANNAITVQDMALDNGGNIYVGGYYIDTLSIDGNMIDSYDATTGGFVTAWFFAKFEPDGNLVWLTDWDVYLYTSHLTAITVDHEGACIGVGADGVGQSAMIKLTSDGNTDWTWRDTWSGSEIYDVSVDASNNIYFPIVTGGNEHFGSLVLPSAGINNHLMVVKLDPSGNGLWYCYPTQFFTQGLPGERTFAIATTSTGTSFIACRWGFAVSTDTFTTYDLSLIKINSAGTIDNARIIIPGNVTSSNLIGAECLNDSGKVLIQGNFYGSSVVIGDDSLSFTFYESTNKMFIAQFEQSLDYDWSLTSGAEVVVGYTTNGNGGGVSSHGDDIYFCGILPGNADFGPDTLSGSYDMFVGKVGTAFTGITSVNATNAYLNVYPNPASQFAECNWQTDNAIAKGISLFDVAGRELLYQPFHSNNKSITIDVSQIPDGIYFLKLSGENFQAAEKLNVIHQ